MKRVRARIWETSVVLLGVRITLGLSQQFVDLSPSAICRVGGKESGVEQESERGKEGGLPWLRPILLIRSRALNKGNFAKYEREDLCQERSSSRALLLRG
jgi:hypothetical protein